MGRATAPPPSSLRAKRSNPYSRAKKEWFASSHELLAMTLTVRCTQRYRPNTPSPQLEIVFERDPLEIGDQRVDPHVPASGQRERRAAAVPISSGSERRALQP